jgi:hypothetical protein
MHRAGDRAGQDSMSKPKPRRPQRVEAKSTVLGQLCYVCGRRFQIGDQVLVHILPGLEGAAYWHDECDQRARILLEEFAEEAKGN